MAKRGWYLKCRTCGGYREGGIDILTPCPYCHQVTQWEKAFEVEYVIGPTPEIQKRFRKKKDQTKAI